MSTTLSALLGHQAKSRNFRFMDIDQIEREGEQAGVEGLDFTACPYRFSRAGVSQEIFDRDWRPKLNAWFHGWKRRYAGHTRPS